MDIKAALKSRQAKWITTVVIILINLLGWIIPDNVPYLIAQNRDILLGRYSLGHFTILVILIPVSFAWLYLTWADENNEKERRFKVIAVTISVLLSLIITDIAARTVLSKRYVVEETYFHRPPNTVHQGVSRDLPEKAFLYPTIQPGYPDIAYTLTTDKRGFRNKTDLERYDIVVLGDSFAEGSRVTDEKTWPALLAEKTKLSVYNLGMSAGHPGTYLETLKKFGPELSPKTVVCLIYEGNDFRDDNFRTEESVSDRLEELFKTSPVRNAIKNFLIRCFGSTAPAPGTSADPNKPAASRNDAQSDKALSWLPVAVPDGPEGKYYTFKVKRLLQHFVTKEDFLNAQGTKKTFAALRQIKAICSKSGSRLVIAYAPDKPHVLLPLISETVGADQIRAFMALRQRRLPPANKLFQTLLPRLDVCESAVREFCRAESIDFVSLTEPLRRATAEGTQTYFTYDQHWTPRGNEIAAETLARYLQHSASSGL